MFPEGTSGYQLDVLARKALWKEGMNYMVRVSHRCDDQFMFMVLIALYSMEQGMDLDRS